MLRDFLRGNAVCGSCNASADNQYVHSAECIMGSYYAQPSGFVAEAVQPPAPPPLETTWDKDLDQPTLNLQFALPRPG